MRLTSILFLNSLLAIPAIAILSMSGLAFAQAPEAPQSNAPPAKRGEAMKQLQSDLETARSHATLTADQKTKLDLAMEKLKSAQENRGEHKGGNRKDLRSAVDDIREIAASGAFREEDRTAVRNDLARIKELAGKRADRRRQ